MPVLSNILTSYGKYIFAGLCFTKPVNQACICLVVVYWRRFLYITY